MESDPRDQVLALAALYLAYHRAFVALQVLLLVTLVVSKLLPHVVVHKEYAQLTLDGCFPVVGVSVPAKTESLTNALRLVFSRLSLAVVLWSLSDAVKERLPFSHSCISAMGFTEAFVLAVEAGLLSRHLEQPAPNADDAPQPPSPSMVPSAVLFLSFCVNLAYSLFYVIVVGPVLFGGDAGGVTSTTGNASQSTQLFMVAWFILWLFYFAYEAVELLVSGRFGIGRVDRAGARISGKKKTQ
jgi:hypothetical protein